MPSEHPSRSTPAGALTRFSALPLALLPLLAPAPADAQQMPELRVGQAVTGALSPSDPVMLSGKGPFRAYRMEARQGDRLILTLRSGAFDAYLSVMRPVGGVHETLAEDDDGGGGTDARLRWTVPATGSYAVVAQSFGSDASGGYTLLVEPAPPIPTRPLPRGESDGGELGEDGIAEWIFQGRAGEVIRVALGSDDFDTVLSFGRRSGGVFEALGENDDAGEETTNSEVEVTLPADGEYVIRVSAFGGTGVGRYTLRADAVR